jgi:hypothetical protein
MYLAPEPPTDLDVRKITLEALAAVLGSSWQPVTGLVTGYGQSHREDVESSYAFQLPKGPALYGCLVEGVLSELHITGITRSAADPSISSAARSI